MKREELIHILRKPLPPTPEDAGWNIYFNPWEDIIKGIDGDYASESDRLMIEALESVIKKETSGFISRVGFSAEFALYTLSGHGLTDYSTSPRDSWPCYEVKDLFPELVSRWKGYYTAVWGIPPGGMEGQPAKTTGEQLRGGLQSL